MSPVPVPGRGQAVAIFRRVAYVVLLVWLVVVVVVLVVYHWWCWLAGATTLISGTVRAS